MFKKQNGEKKKQNCKWRLYLPSFLLHWKVKSSRLAGETAYNSRIIHYPRIVSRRLFFYAWRANLHKIYPQKQMPLLRLCGNKLFHCRINLASVLGSFWKWQKALTFIHREVGFLLHRFLYNGTKWRSFNMSVNKKN